MLIRLSDQIEEIDDRLATIREKLQEPAFLKVSADYRQMKKVLLEKAAKREKELNARFQTATKLNPEIVALKSRIEILKVQEKAGAKSLEQQRLKAERFGNSSIDVEMMRSELQYLDKVLSPIADEREKLKVELRSTPRITMFQKAEPPKTADSRARLRNAALGGRRRPLGRNLSGLVVGRPQAADQFAGRPLPRARADGGRHRASAAAGKVTAPVAPARIAPARIAGIGCDKWQTSLDHAVDSIAARLFLRKERRRRAGGDGFQRDCGRGKDHARRAAWRRDLPARESRLCWWITICGGRRSIGSSACRAGRGSASACREASVCELLRFASVVHATDAENLGRSSRPAEAILESLGPLGQRRHHRPSSKRPAPRSPCSSSTAARSCP